LHRALNPTPKGAPFYNAWEPFRQSLEQWVPQCRIIYDKFHVLQHAGKAVDEVRRAEFFRKGGPARDIVRGKRWLLLSSWVHLLAIM